MLHSHQGAVGSVLLHCCLLIYLVSYSAFFLLLPMTSGEKTVCCESLCPRFRFICADIYYLANCCIFIFDERSYLSNLLVDFVIL